MTAVMLLLPLAVTAKTSQASATAPAKKQTNAAAVVVQVAKVKQAAIPIEIEALGSLSAVDVVTISTESDGRVQKVYFKNGQQVGKDMPILKLDSSQAQANYDSAVTTLNLNRSKYQRALKLPVGTISKQDLENLKAAVENSDAEVKKDLATLNNKTVTAPFAGVLGAFQVQPGDYVKAGTPVVSLVSRALLRVNFNIPQNLLPKLKMGQLVTITVDAYPKQSFYGTVSYISPTVNKETRQVAVEAMVQNKSNLLSPGMFCHVAQQVGMNHSALMVPEQAVNADIKGFYVYQVEGQQAVRTGVTTGLRRHGQVQIASGLKLNDVVVISGQQKLQDGSPVVISDNDSGTVG
jgi:membrane fusion protein (multidrug efflux system)